MPVHIRNLILRLTVLCLVLLVPGVSCGKSLSSYRIDLNQTSVSGLSSGAFMAGQFHVAFSKEIMGAGIVAGGPFYCACESPYVQAMITAMTTCMNPCKTYEAFGGCSNSFVQLPSGENLAQIAQTLSGIDDLKYLKTDKVYIFSGEADEVVITKVVDQTEAFYRAAGVMDQNILYESHVDSGHAFITDNKEDTRCSQTESPYLNDCGFIQSHRILEHIYGKLNPPGDGSKGQLYKFSQSEFVNSPISSMGETGYVYIPDSCKDNSCRIHVVFHGCKQSVSAIGDKLLVEGGYNEMAETNKIIILYPQLKASATIPFNPMGCWDFWGYTSSNPLMPDFYKKSGVQISAVKKMIDRLAGKGGQVR